MRSSRRIADTINLHLCFGITLNLFCLCTSDPPKSNFALTKDTNAYADCDNKTLSCVGVGDENCIKDQTCQIFITYLTDLHSVTAKNRVYFQVIMTNQILGTQVNRYVATGISTNIKMEDDIVVSCIRHNYPKVPLSAYLSYNIPEKLNNEFANIPQNQLITEEVVDLDGKTYCAFSIPTAITVGPVTVSSDGRSLHLLVAVGRSKSIQQLGYHHHWYTTSTPLNLSLPGRQHIISDSELGAKAGLLAHSILMIITFICIIPTATLIARFLKESHLKRRMCHRKFWFIIHTYGLILGIVLVTISLTVITITVGGVFKRTAWKFLFHYYLGLAITALYFIQIVVGLFLYVNIIDSHTRALNLGSFVHFLNGTLIQVLSFIQIFFSPKYMHSFLRFCSVASIVLAVWVGMYVAAHVTLTVTLFLSDLKEFKAVAVKAKEAEAVAVKEKEKEDTHSSDSGGFVHHPEDDSLSTILISKDNDLEPNSDTEKKTGKKRKKGKRKKPAPLASSSAPAPAPFNLKLISSRLKAWKNKNPPVPPVPVPVPGPVKTKGQRSQTPSLRSRSRHSRKRRNKETSQHPHPKHKRKKNHLKSENTASSPKLGITTSQISKSKSKKSRASKRSSKGALAIRSHSKKSRKSRKSLKKKLTNASTSNTNTSLSQRSRSNKIGSAIEMAMPSTTESLTSPKAQKSELNNMTKSDAKLSHEEMEAGKETKMSMMSKRDTHTHGPGHEHDFGEGGVGMVHIVPRTKDLVYDDFPDYEMENVAKTGKMPKKKVATKERMKDPLRAFTKYPMQICFTRENPKTRTFDLIIVIFFGMSLLMSVVLISFLSPYQGHGEDHCSSKSWMVDFP